MGALGRSGRRGGERQEIVFGEIAGLGTRFAEGLFESAHGVLGDVLVEGARRRPSRQDALDGAVVEGPERGGVSEGAVDVGGGVALAEQQDLTSAMAPDPGHAKAH